MTEQETLDEVAKEKGYENWTTLIQDYALTGKTHKDTLPLLWESMRRYAEQVNKHNWPIETHCPECGQVICLGLTEAQFEKWQNTGVAISREHKTASTIRDEVAKENRYTNWDSLMFSYRKGECIERVFNQALDEAAERYHAQFKAEPKPAISAEELMDKLAEFRKIEKDLWIEKGNRFNTPISDSTANLMLEIIDGLEQYQHLNSQG